MKCNCPLKDVYEAGFAVVEANLFLDTHPCSEEALCYLKNASEKYMNARAEYAASYGPLTITESKGDCYHDWVKGPWPWEGGMH